MSINCAVTVRVLASLRLCPTTKWECGSGECLPPEMRCDGESQCKDHSDELHCAVDDVLDVFSILCGHQSNLFELRPFPNGLIMRFLSLSDKNLRPGEEKGPQWFIKLQVRANENRNKWCMDMDIGMSGEKAERTVANYDARSQ
ncbi:unnamed protein product [Toxocara canis]|uniref:Low-density lipoprotein receptor domain class A n=1 Tax=Toxocara canis TaxID=6265 RepID=A0A183VF28_TOXCA|nr:unnamed protein product [Toxocara canis]